MNNPESMSRELQDTLSIVYLHVEKCLKLNFVLNIFNTYLYFHTNFCSEKHGPSEYLLIAC